MGKIHVGIIKPSGFVMEDCFLEPDEWDEKSKTAYSEWLARMPDEHPCKSDPAPWKSPQ